MAITGCEGSDLAKVTKSDDFRSFLAILRPVGTNRSRFEEMKSFEKWILGRSEVLGIGISFGVQQLMYLVWDVAIDSSIFVCAFPAVRFWISVKVVANTSIWSSKNMGVFCD